jgi:hypothetical protein
MEAGLINFSYRYHLGRGRAILGPMRWLTLLLALFTAAAAAADKVYKIVHPDGTVEYSADPAPGAEEIQVPSLPTYTPRAPAPAPAPSQPAAAEAEQAVEYQVRITQPSPEQTVNFDAAGMPVSASVQPGISAEEGQVVVFVLDGNSRERVSGTSATLHVERGAHTLVARLESKDGQVLATSAPVTFYMRQRSRLHPPPRSAPSGATRTP